MPRTFLHYSLAAAAVLTMLLLPLPIAHAQKEQFVRSKPHVNVGTTQLNNATGATNTAKGYIGRNDGYVQQIQSSNTTAKAKVNAVKTGEIPELKPARRRIDLKASSLYGLAAPHGQETRPIKTRSHSGQRSGGDADLRVRVGADPTITSPGLLGNAAVGLTSQGPGGTGAATSSPGANSIRAR